MSSRGYQSGQFFNIEQSRPDRWRTGSFVSDNALNRPFLFPDKSIRVPHGKGDEAYATLEKGYIRRISEFDEGTERPLLCRFQFNPQYLNQQAVFASGMTHPIYQEAAQLKQPMASMTNFSFRLMFDRTMELNNGLPSIDTARLRNRVSDNPWEKGEPSQVGVLHDLAALYRVIGQGVSSADIESAIGRAAESLAASRIGVIEDETTINNANTALQNANDFFTASNNVNVGNTGFILPFPVRCVFSTLYIVEGFVTSTSMEILKFNSAYVPMAAQVTLAVNALYIGFAKSNTFFTHVLAQSAEERRIEREQKTSEQNAAVSILVNELSNFHVKLVRSSDDPETGFPDQVIKFNELFDNASRPKPSNEYLLGSVYGSPTDWVRPQQTLVVDNSGTATLTPGSINPGTSAGTAPPGVTPPSPAVISDGVVAGYFDNGKITQLTYKWKATLFGPINESGPIATSPLDVFLNNPVIRSSARIVTGLSDDLISVDVATTAPLPAFTFSNNVITSSSNSALPPIDGVSLSVGNIVLVKNAAGDNGRYNGIYAVTSLGGASDTFKLTRTGTLLTNGVQVRVSNGSSNAGSQWVLSTPDPITLNTTNLVFTSSTAPSSPFALVGDFGTKVITVSTKQQWLDLASPSASTGIIFSVPAFLSSSIDNVNYWIMLFEAECDVSVDGLRFVSKAHSAVTLGRNSTAPMAAQLRFDWSPYLSSLGATSVSPAVSPPSGPTPVPTPGDVYEYIPGGIDKLYNARDQVLGF